MGIVPKTQPIPIEMIVEIAYEEIIRRRRQLGLSTTDAANRAGWRTGRAWTNVEKMGRDLRLSTLAKIASVLRCEVKDLLK